MGEDSDGERDVEDAPDRENSDTATDDLQTGADVPVGDHEGDDQHSHAEQPDPTAVDQPDPTADRSDVDAASDDVDDGTVADDDTDAGHTHGRTGGEAHGRTGDDDGTDTEEDADEEPVGDEPTGDAPDDDDGAASAIEGETPATDADERLRERDDPSVPGVGTEPPVEVDEEFPERDATGAASASTLEESDEAFPAGTGTSAPTGTADETPLDRKTGGGPQTDEELPLADHIEEMIKRLAVVVAVAGLMSLVVWPFGEEIINHLWYAVLPGTDIAAPHIYQPLELLITQFKVASLAGLIVALPVFVYQTYAFMRPGLYPHERRYYLAAVPTSLVLALLGVTFAYFVVLPAIFGYFYNYSQPVADIAFALSDTFNLILILLGYLALVFQIPLFIMLAIMMGITSRQWLEDRRLLFWGVFLGVSFLFTPDPTGVAPILVAATMIALFEATLALLRWTGR